MVSRPYFFFSYARDDGGTFLDEFFDELQDEVRLRIQSQDEVGFKDDLGIGLGQRWTDELVRALGHCQVFVAVYSVAYFDSDYCGKEWRIFADRCRAAGIDPAAEQPRIFPLLWTPRDYDIPEPVGTVQYDHAQLGQDYRQYGAHRLVKNPNAYPDAAKLLAADFADMLLAVKDTELPVSNDKPDIRQVQSAFVQPDAAAGGRPAVLGRGPKHVHFVYMAGSAAEIDDARPAPGAYGELAHEWQPYAPEAEDRIGLLSQRVATEVQLMAETTDPSVDLLDQLDGELKRDIVALVVDLWSLDVGEFAKLLRRYDKMQLLNCTLLMPERPPGEDAQQARQVMWELFEEICGTKIHMATDPVAFRWGIASRDEFEKVLATTLVEIQGRILRSAPARRFRGSGPARKPQLGGARS